MPQIPDATLRSLFVVGALLCAACGADDQLERNDTAAGDGGTDALGADVGNDAGSDAAGDVANDTDTGDSGSDAEIDGETGTTTCAQWAADIDYGSDTNIVLNGTTLGAGNDNTASCGGQRGEDLVGAWTAPDSGPYVFETHGSEWDTVLSVIDDCGMELSCNDDDREMGLLTSAVQIEVEAGSRYGIVIDGYEQLNVGAGGPVTLRITPLNRDSESGYCADKRDNDSDGTVDCADADCLDDLACGPLTDVAQICAAGSTTCARLEDGTVTCWGNGNDGLIPGTRVSLRPTVIEGLPTPATDISCGGQHTCAVLDDGEVWCWGAGYYGQLGDGNQSSPGVPVHANPLADATSVSAGGNHTCAVLANGDGSCWGYGSHGQFGVDSQSYWNVPGLSGFQDVQRFATGGYHTCALNADGEVHCAGYNYQGQVGIPYTDQQTVFEPVRVDVEDITLLSASNSHTCVASAIGAWCWGDNNYAQLGGGNTTLVYGPVVVEGLNNVTDIVAATYHTCAINDGDVLCWGNNNQFALGHEDADGSVPRVVAGIPTATQVVAGQFHTCTLSEAGEVWCWGYGANGQLGSGEPLNSTTPVRVLSVPSSL